MATVGVFGGMGPLTGYDYFKLLVDKIPAKADTDHPNILFWSDPTIPRKDQCIEEIERNNGVVSTEKDARPGLRRGMDIFKHAKVSFIVVPCNTFHYFREELEAYAGIEILNMISVVARAILAQDASVKKVGLLSTCATGRYKIYDKEFIKHNIEIINPEPEEQNEVQDVIELVKQGKCDEEQTKAKLTRVIKSLEEKGLDFIILGCTELPLVIRPSLYNGRAKLIDSTFELAKETLAKLDRIKPAF